MHFSQQQVSPQTIAATNTGPVRVRGVELAVALGLTEWVDLSVNWTYLQTELERSSINTLLAQSGGVLPGRPENEVGARVRVGPASKLWKLVTAVQYTSEIPLTFSGNSVVSARTVVDLKRI